MYVPRWRMTWGSLVALRFLFLHDIVDHEPGNSIGMAGMGLEMGLLQLAVSGTVDPIPRHPVELKMHLQYSDICVTVVCILRRLTQVELLPFSLGPAQHCIRERRDVVKCVTTR